MPRHLLSAPRLRRSTRDVPILRASIQYRRGLADDSRAASSCALPGWQTSKTADGNGNRPMIGWVAACAGRGAALPIAVIAPSQAFHWHAVHGSASPLARASAHGSRTRGHTVCQRRQRPCATLAPCYKPPLRSDPALGAVAWNCKTRRVSGCCFRPDMGRDRGGRFRHRVQQLAACHASRPFKARPHADAGAENEAAWLRQTATSRRTTPNRKSQKR
jgi:hypothetical protein